VGRRHWRCPGVVQGSVWPENDPMVMTPGRPWSVTLDYSHDVAFALVVRDALGITDPSGLPEVHPPQVLAVDPAVRADGGADRLWQHWWDRALARAGQEEAGPPVPPEGALGRVVGGNLGVLQRWSAARKREVARAGRPTDARPRLRDVLHAYEQRTGVRPGGFHLRVTAVPVAGPVFLALDADRVLVSTALLSDRAEYLARILAHVGLS